MNKIEQVITQNFDIWSSAVKKKSSVGRGSNSKIELYGVKKLRELILDLAVRGLLVPQDPNDEPASELLKKIANEKSIKKQNQLTFVREDEIPYELPNGWVWVRLGEIHDVTSSKRIHVKDYCENGVPFLRSKEIGELGKGLEVSTELFISREKYETLRNLPGFPQEGDFMLASIGGSIGNNWICDNREFYYKDGNVTKIGNHSLANIHYLKIFMKSILFWNQVTEGVSGSAYNALTIIKIKGLVFPLPSLEEQKRIVAKVDELMTLCDTLEKEQTNNIESHQTLVQVFLDSLINSKDSESFDFAWKRISDNFDILFTTEWSIDQLKQTILQLAVMGKLVKQDPNDEPASELLKKIASEKAKLIKEGKIKKIKPLPNISEEEKLFKLPKGWEFVRLNDLGEWGAGSTPSRSNPELYGGTIPWFKSGELISDYISESEETVTDLALKKSSLRYNKVGDVLIAMYGATIGKTAILLVPATTNQAVCACTPFSGFSNTYLLTILKAFKKYFIGMGAGGAQPNISREKIIATVIALPPLEEQKRIVAKVDELMTLCDTLKEKISLSQELQLKLSDAIAHNSIN